MEYRDLISDYEQLLIGNVEKMPAYHFKGVNKKSTKTCICLLKYIYEDIMHWAPQEASELFDEKYEKAFKLDGLILKSFDFPPGLTKKEKSKYLAHCCYPNEVGFNKQRLIVKTYEGVLEKQQKWEKKYFTGEDGLVRACICMQYAINKYLYSYNIAQLYDFFSDSNRAIDFFSKIKLKKVYEALFDLPIDFFHYSLIKEQRDDFLYYYYKFRYYYNNIVDNAPGVSKANMLDICSTSKEEY